MPHNVIHFTAIPGGGPLLIGLLKEHGRWNLAFEPVGGRTESTIVREFTGYGFRIIHKIDPGDSCCFRVETGVLRCYESLPGDCQPGEIQFPTHPAGAGHRHRATDHHEDHGDSADHQHEGCEGLQDFYHPTGFHVMCECGTEWRSCHMSQVPACCN